MEAHTAGAVLCGKQGQNVNPKGIDRSKVRVGSRKLAGDPQRYTERQSVSSVLWWAR